MISTDKKLYNVMEISKILGIGKAKVYELIKTGVLPVMNLGGLKVRKEVIDEFILTYEGYDLKDSNCITKLLCGKK